MIIRPIRDPSTIRPSVDLVVLRRAGRRLVGGTAVGLMVLAVIAFTNTASAGTWLVSGLAAGLTQAVTAWLDVPSLFLVPPSASRSYRHDRTAALASALAVFVIWFLAARAAVALWMTNPRQIVLVASDGLQIGVALGLGFGVCLVATRSVGRFAIARLWLVATGRLSWRVFIFSRMGPSAVSSLRSGSAYRFHYAMVQRRLATMGVGPTRGDVPASSPSCSGVWKTAMPGRGPDWPTSARHRVGILFEAGFSTCDATHVYNVVDSLIYDGALQERGPAFGNEEELAALGESMSRRWRTARPPTCSGSLPP